MTKYTHEFHDLRYRSVLHTENVARGQTESFQNVGGKGVYNVLTFPKSRGARAHLGEANAPSYPPK